MGAVTCVPPLVNDKRRGESYGVFAYILVGSKALGHATAWPKTLWFETFGLGSVPESGVLDWTPL